MSDYSIPSLRKYAYLGNFDVAIKELADMARPERWDYVETPDAKKNIILENYIYHTFDRLLALRKAVPKGNYISTSDSEMCFNTGLFTPNFEPIFALFNKNDASRKIKWKLRGFYKESSIELNKIVPLPCCFGLCQNSCKRELQSGRPSILPRAYSVSAPHQSGRSQEG